VQRVVRQAVNLKPGKYEFVSASQGFDHRQGAEGDGQHDWAADRGLR
jgi:hypothetical protein